MQAEKISITVTVNGERRTIETFPHHTLLEFLRDQLGLTGTKECCSQGECGSCTVLMNGRSVDSCLVLAVEADAGEIVTIEGTGSPGKLSALQAAFAETGAVQCGFCIPGMIMSAGYLLQRNPHPTVEEIKEGLDGNLCRCAGYSLIIQAVKKAAEAGE
ncbi:MAG TPA: (2Fe-2S)-binding protein [Bryobacteraceae bacterium]|nr:(2Fe-2S)-binding protein [Bryobacteraceae bacterium]